MVANCRGDDDDSPLLLGVVVVSRTREDARQDGSSWMANIPMSSDAVYCFGSHLPRISNPMWGLVPCVRRMQEGGWTVWRGGGGFSRRCIGEGTHERRQQAGRRHRQSEIVLFVQGTAVVEDVSRCPAAALR